MKTTEEMVMEMLVQTVSPERAAEIARYIEARKNDAMPPPDAGTLLMTLSPVEFVTREFRAALLALTDEERLEVLDGVDFCRHCGSDGSGCQCWNDE